MYVPHTSSYHTLRIVGLTLGLEPNPDANGSCGDSLFLFGFYICYLAERSTNCDKQLTRGSQVIQTARQCFLLQQNFQQDSYGEDFFSNDWVKLFHRPTSWQRTMLTSAFCRPVCTDVCGRVSMCICVCVRARTWEPFTQCLWVFVPGLAWHAGSQWRRPGTRRHLTKECNDLGAWWGVQRSLPYTPRIAEPDVWMYYVLCITYYVLSNVFISFIPSSTTYGPTKTKKNTARYSFLPTGIHPEPFATDLNRLSNNDTDDSSMSVFPIKTERKRGCRMYGTTFCEESAPGSAGHQHAVNTMSLANKPSDTHISQHSMLYIVL